MRKFSRFHLCLMEHRRDNQSSGLSTDYLNHSGVLFKWTCTYSNVLFYEVELSVCAHCFHVWNGNDLSQMHCAKKMCLTKWKVSWSNAKKIIKHEFEKLRQQKNLIIVSFKLLAAFNVWLNESFTQFDWSVLKGNFHFDLILIEFYQNDIAFCGLVFIVGVFVLRAYAHFFLVELASLCITRTESFD